MNQIQYSFPNEKRKKIKMAKSIHKTVIAEFLNPDTKLRIVRIKGNEEVEKIMTVLEWREFKRQSGYIYRAYQIT